MPDQKDEMTRLHKKLIESANNTIEKYGLMARGDRILVGLSGGKDSFALWKILNDLYKSRKSGIDLYAAFIDAGFKGAVDTGSVLAGYIISNDQILIINKETFAEDIAKSGSSKNPCFLCSRARRKSLVQLSNQLKCNKIALAHHKDDVIETLLLNIFYGREISTMMPKQPLFDGRFFLIRPFWEIEENLIRTFAAEQGFPIIKNQCQFSGKSKRETIKTIIDHLQRENKTVKESIFSSLFHINRNFLP